MTKLFAFAFSLAVGVTPLAAQSQQPDPQAQGPTFRTGVEVIAVDVAVTDGDGDPVEDLLPPDFEVKVDGQPRRVVSAEHVRVDVEAARREAANPFETLYTTNLKPLNGRMFVIAVDQLAVRFAGARAILDTAGKFVDSLSPADRTAFVAYPEPGIQVGFTNDALRLKQAMTRVVGRQERFQGRFTIGLYEAIAITERGDGRIFSQVIQRECPRVTGVALEQCERDVLSEAGTIVRQVRQDTAESLRGLYNLLLGLSVIEGQKTLLLISEGLVLDRPTDLDDVVKAAAYARVTVNVLLLDSPRHDITVTRLQPTPTEDRNMQVSGLGDLAASTRGEMYYVAGTGQTIFDRIAADTLAYYVLGVEQAPSDRDGEQHRIDVDVRRRGVTVKSRRAFVLSSATTTRQTAEETLMDALRSPFGVTEVPIRLTTFTQKDPASDKSRLTIAAEVGQPGAGAEEYTVGFVLLDDTGAVVTGSTDKRTLTVPDDSPASPADYLAEVLVEPGTYSLRFGVVDPTGRRGGVIRDVNAWKLGGEEFALGDLLIGDAGTDGRRSIRPGVEPRVRGNLAAFLEVYSTSPAALTESVVTFEIADDQDAPALLTAPAEILPGGDPSRRLAQSLLSPSMLPPGRYVARARVTRGGTIAGVLARPFIVDSSEATPSPFIRGSVAPFDVKATLQRDLLDGMIEGVLKRSPELKGPVADAKAGRYGAAALDALAAGDQAAAAFFKGLEWYTKGQLNEAATQLTLAAGPRNEFFPAAFYLGAAYAAAGRDREAAGVWQLALGREPRPAVAYIVLADARLRDNQADAVIEVLRDAHQRTPDDDAISERLTAAYLMTGRYEEALPVLDRYLTAHPTDDTALFAAVYAQYQVTTREKLALSPADQTRIGRYVRAYSGPYRPLLAKYFEIMRR